MAAVSAQGERVWTSGGVKENPTLRLWSHNGDPRCSVPLHDKGDRSASCAFSDRIPEVPCLHSHSDLAVETCSHLYTYSAAR